MGHGKNPRVQFFPAKAVPERNNLDFYLAMVGNPLILAHFSEECAHFDETLYILARWDSQRQENFQHFPHQPRPGQEQTLDFSRQDIAKPPRLTRDRKSYEKSDEVKIFLVVPLFDKRKVSARSLGAA